MCFQYLRFNTKYKNTKVYKVLFSLYAMVNNRWELEDVEFKGQAYKKISKKVVKAPAYGFITLPRSLIGKNVTVIIVPEN